MRYRRVAKRSIGPREARAAVPDTPHEAVDGGPLGRRVRYRRIATSFRRLVEGHADELATRVRLGETGNSAASSHRRLRRPDFDDVTVLSVRQQLGWNEQAFSVFTNLVLDGPSPWVRHAVERSQVR